MPKYFFHQHLNGKPLALDYDGLCFVDNDKAIDAAFELVSRLMAKVSPKIDEARQENRGNGTHLSVEVTDGANILSIVRGKVYVETLNQRSTKSSKTLPP